MNKIDIQRFGEELNELCAEKMIIRIGRYEGDYHVGDGEFKRITGELFVKTNSDTIFRVVSDDSSIVDDFDIIGSDVIITPINKEFENSSIPYNELDVSNKESLRAYFPNDEIGIEMFECVQSLPVRFREDAVESFKPIEDREMWDSISTVNKHWDYFLIEIIEEMTEEEKEKYFL